MRLSLFVLGCLGLLGCSSGPTEIVVRTTTDLAVPREVDAVELEVDARGIGGGRDVRRIALSDSAALPARFTVVHRAGPLGPLRLHVRGLLDDERRVERTAELYFVEARSTLATFELTAECRAMGCNGLEDAGAGPLDASPDDAGIPSPGDAGIPSCQTISCGEERCECSTECSGCELLCEAGEDCDAHCHDQDCAVRAVGGSDVKVHCKEAHCVVDATGASNVDEVRCDRGATCDVDCRDASSCRVECRHDAACVVDCNGASSCELTDCEPEDCGGSVFACGTPCP